jgi:hypothetical protein
MVNGTLNAWVSQVSGNVVGSKSVIFSLFHRSHGCQVAKNPSYNMVRLVT